MTPAEIILKKALVASKIPSSQWDLVRCELRQRAFFSSKIESYRFLADARKAVADMLSEARTSRGTIVSREDAIAMIQESGRDLATITRRRAALIVDTNAGLAAGCVRHLADSSPGAQMAFPAKELFRAPQSNPAMPRKWHERWRENGGTIYNNRMIALVDDPVWVAISRFGLPYPPFDFNSGMITRPLSREECIGLGIIKPDWKPSETSPQPAFNDDLQESVDIGHWRDGDFERLKDDFKDQVDFTQRADGTMTAKWKAHLVRDFFDNGNPAHENGGLRSLGKAQSTLLEKVPNDARDLFSVKSVSIQKELVTHMISHGHWPKEKNLKRNLQLSPEELDIIPEVWRSPDRVVKGGGKSWILELDSFSGGTYRLVVEINANGARIETFYKRK